MKKLLAVFIVALGLLTGCHNNSTPVRTYAPATSSHEQVEDTVIITKTGSKYHSHTHGNMKYTEEVEISYATSHGYTACSVCYG